MILKEKKIVQKDQEEEKIRQEKEKIKQEKEDELLYLRVLEDRLFFNK